MAHVELPYKWKPRAYQKRLWKYMEGGGRRAMCIWHRRTGKDLAALNWCVTQMVQRVGVYWHLFPTYKQGRKAIWQNITNDGRKYLDHFPPELIKGKPNNTDMMIEFKNNSIYQVVGTDDIDRLVGTNPVGLIVSEFPLQNPDAWDLLRPILAANHGWVIFLFTPRGHNHAHDLYKAVKNNDKWFVETLTVDDTTCPLTDMNGGIVLDKEGKKIIVPVVPPEVIEEERESGMDEAKVQQEYYCSFDAPLVGSYYGDAMTKSQKEGRIGMYPYNPNQLVHTAWDLGLNDKTAIWFFQATNGDVRLIDYYENENEKFGHYLKYVKEKDYIYGDHLGPHDIDTREYISGVSRIQYAEKMGVKFTAVPKIGRLDGIEAVRQMIPICTFHQRETFEGIEHLRSYRKEYDRKRKVYRNTPLHDDSSNGADAFRTLAVGLKMVLRMRFDAKTFKPQKAETDYNVHNVRMEPRRKKQQLDANQLYDKFRGH